MAKREVRIKELKIKDSVKIVRISVFYGIGGINYFTGRTQPRGYWLDAQPIEVSDGWTSFTAFTGVKNFIQEANRFSQKAMEKVAESITDEQIEQLIVWVETNNGVEVIRE